MNTFRKATKSISLLRKFQSVLPRISLLATYNSFIKTGGLYKRIIESNSYCGLRITRLWRRNL